MNKYKSIQVEDFSKLTFKGQKKSKLGDMFVFDIGFDNVIFVFLFIIGHGFP